MSDTKLSNEFQESINRLREKNEKSIKVISKKHFMSKDMVDKVLTKHPHWKIETECKWRKEAIRDADEYGDDAHDEPVSSILVLIYKKIKDNYKV